MSTSKFSVKLQTSPDVLIFLRLVASSSYTDEVSFFGFLGIFISKSWEVEILVGIEDLHCEKIQASHDIPCEITVSSRFQSPFPQTPDNICTRSGHLLSKRWKQNQVPHCIIPAHIIFSAGDYTYVRKLYTYHAP